MARTNGNSRNDEYIGARRAMVREQLQRRGITDHRVLQAMQDVPRHLFVPHEWQTEAYSDRPLPIGEGQTISQPYMVALMLQNLALQSDARVLEVGTGSGYQTAVLSQLAAHIYSMEYFPSLAEEARTILRALGYTNVDIIVGDGGLGLPQHAPYDGIVVAAAAPRLPRLLIEQLSAGGRLVLPLGNTAGQELQIITKQGASYTKERSVPCRFVPLLGQEG